MRPFPSCSVDVGSTAVYTDSRGTAWQADQAYQAGTTTWGYVGDSGTYATSDPVWGTGDQPLYQTERFWTNGSGGYRFVVPNGDYEVLLKLAEIYPGTKVGTRVFSVNVEGVTAVAHLDLTELVGPNVAYDVLAPAHVTDGVLSVDMVTEQNFPALKAIAVFSPRPCTPTVTPSPTASATATASAHANRDCDGDCVRDVTARRQRRRRFHQQRPQKLVDGNDDTLETKTPTPRHRQLLPQRLAPP